MLRFFSALVLNILVVALLSGCGVYNNIIKDAYTDYNKGYLKQEDLPDILSLLPKPPEKGTAEFRLDLEKNQKALKLQKTARWDQASTDGSEGVDNFSCAINAPINSKYTPIIYKLMTKSHYDVRLAISKTKNHYMRIRPFVMNNQPMCTPKSKDFLSTNGSYPSGHTSNAWTMALILAEISPNRKDEILKRGWEQGESRIICNVHWYSDVVQGRLAASAIFTSLHSSDEFKDDIVAAKKELEEVYKAKLKPSVDCALEAARLASCDD